MMTVDCGTDVTFDDVANITIFDFSKWAERGFCNKCGSHLFYRLKGNNQHMILAGLFNEYQQFVFNRQLFIDEKPDFYSFANETDCMAGAEVFEKYAPSLE